MNCDVFEEAKNTEPVPETENGMFAYSDEEYKVQMANKEDLDKISQEVYDWKPDINYPYDIVVTYYPESKRSKSDNFNTSFSKRIGGKFGPTNWLESQ